MRVKARAACANTQYRTGRPETHAPSGFTGRQASMSATARAIAADPGRIARKRRFRNGVNRSDAVRRHHFALCVDRAPAR